jgi:hypothetical protein
MNSTRLKSCLAGFVLASPFFAQAALAQTSSPFEPPEEELGIYTVNSGSGLDTGCTFRNGGPLLISLYVPATMNSAELDENGFLRDPQKLIQNKVIGATAKISYPTFDIDDKANSDEVAPEVDIVSFNGEEIKTLEGFDNQWVNDSFTVDISKVKFNQANEIRIDIDTENTIQAWCMSVDWVSIEFDSAAPYVLAHGISAQADTWDEATAEDVLTTIDDSGVLYTRFSTDPAGRATANARDLKTQIAAFLDTVKAKKVNVIAHSKGGLDIQALAVISEPEFEMLSLSTLSTPHLGSSIADVTILQRQAIDEYVLQDGDPNGFLTAFLDRDVAGWGNRRGQGPQLPGLTDLTTQAASAAILARLRNNIPNTFTIGADAGPNCLGNPTDAEIEPMAPFGTGFYVNDALRESYRIICEVESALQIRVDTETSGFGLIRTVTLTYDFEEISTNNPNDIVVGINSANPGWGRSLGVRANTNHSTVKNGANVQSFLDQTIKLR